MSFGYPKMGPRIRQKMREQGCFGPTQQAQFCRMHGYGPAGRMVLFRALQGNLIEYDHLLMLCKDLLCTPGWLMFGDAAFIVPLLGKSNLNHKPPALAMRQCRRCLESKFLVAQGMCDACYHKEWRKKRYIKKKKTDAALKLAQERNLADVRGGGRQDPRQDKDAGCGEEEEVI